MEANLQQDDGSDSVLWDLRTYLPFTATLIVCGCANPPSPTGLTAEQAAKQGIEALERGDGEVIGRMVWQAEADRTGLSASAVKAVVEGPFKTLTAGYKPEGAIVTDPLSSSQVAAERTYRNRAGQRRGFSLIATSSGANARLTPLSMQLFVMMGNAEQKESENHYTAWRRMLTRERPMFESVGWRGMINSSEFSSYKSWDQQDAWLAEQEQQENERRKSRKH